MTTKDIKQQTKTSLMDELKSIKGVLNSDDDNVPLLLEDEDIPVLADEEDVPVLTAPEDDLKANQASLDAAIRQLESMELPKAGNPPSSSSLEEKIRNNAAPPAFQDKATTVRENPFLKKPADRFSESRKQAEAALQSVITHSRATAVPPSRASAPEEKRHGAPVTDTLSESSVEFTDNQFLKASSAAPTSVSFSNKKPPSPASKQEEDGSEAILKLLEEESEVHLDLDDDFSDLVDIDVDALIAEQAPVKQAPNKAVMPPPARQTTKPAPSIISKPTDEILDAVVDEVVEEYMIILEAALKKKLKEKLPDLLKK